jgi:hypothetical protein
MQKIKYSKYIFFLCAVMAFVGSSFTIAYYNVKTTGALYLQSDDGDLYLSIVRNMLENAHFIQTARPIEAFVVPPGLPAVSTLLIFLTGKLSEIFVSNGFGDYAIGQASPDMLGLLGFQYIIYGLTAALMAVTGLKLSFNGLRKEEVPKPLPWVLAAVIGIATPAFYVWCSIRIRHPNPGFILTENYVVFLIALVLWLVVKGTDVRKITFVTFILTLFRPACSPLLIAAFAWMVIRAIHDRVAKNKPPIRERVRFYDIFIMLAVFALIIGINVGVNYIETKEIIPLEDYSSMDVYLANNDKAGPEWYHSGKVPEFANTRYNQIALNDSLTRYQQNKLAKEALTNYVKGNTETVLKNAGVRFVRLFCDTWGVVFYAFLVCLVLQMILKGLNWTRKAYILLSAVFLSVMPAFGLLVARYSAPIFPLFIAITIGSVGQIICILATKEKKEAVSAPVPAPEEPSEPQPAPEQPA